ncbi:MAG: hypothetical protein RBU37_16010, partial [Myxococcota bacterium]|nr:hypothetical protein [Myxococcota bacterium]
MRRVVLWLLVLLFSVLLSCSDDPPGTPSDVSELDGTELAEVDVEVEDLADEDLSETELIIPTDQTDGEVEVSDWDD